MKDVVQTIIAFGSYSGHPSWSSEADFNNDRKVDMKDIIIVIIHFGECAKNF